MPDIDFFGFFRFWLATIVTIYASIVTLQSFRNWTSWLAGSDKYSSLLRRYLLVHGLRLRFISFWGAVLICGLLPGGSSGSSALPASPPIPTSVEIVPARTPARQLHELPKDELKTLAEEFGLDT